MKDESNTEHGRRLFILPSTFVGSTRYKRQQIYDIIVISNKGGHRDIFLTVICSPSWPETQRSLPPGQLYAHRSDLYARVFRMKLLALMSSVIQEKLFGTVVANVRVVEFLKRGLRRAHIIFFLDETFKHEVRSLGKVDEVISAQESL